MKQFNVISSLALGLIFFISFNQLNAQPWLLPKNGGTMNFHEVQKSFNQYWGPKKVVGGWYTDKNGKKRKAQGWKQFKRWEWYWKNRINPVTGEFPDVNAIGQYKKHLRLTKSLKASVQGNWTSVGPSNVDLAGRGTGRINCITFHPTDNNTFWVGAPAGGVWRTNDHGSTWTVLTDANQVLGVSDICLATDFTTSNTIYIATGDKDGGSLWGQNGGQAHDNESVGILKSTNGGLSWQATGLTATVKEHFIVARIIAHPGNTTTLWTATNLGIYKSTDAGASWTFKQGGAFIDMEMKPGDPNTLYASTSVFGTPYPQIYRSIDGGETWSLIQIFTIDQYRCDLEVSPNDPTVVYAAVSMTDYNNSYADYGSLYGIYKSTDSGASFSQVYDGTAIRHNLFGWETDGSDAGGQGDYDLAFAVNPADANEVYIGGVNGHLSTDGANSFSAVSCWTSSITYNHNSSPVVHADHHMAKYRPSDGMLFDVNDGGVYYTTNSGSTWTEITAGLVNGQLYGISVAQNVSDEVLGGYQDNGTKLKDNGTTDWIDVKGGDGMNCAIDITNDNIQYGTYAEGQIDRTTNKWGNQSSIRSGGTADWAAPLEIDPAGGSTLYFGDEFVKYYNGSWNTLSASLSPSADGYLQALSIYHVGADLYIYTSDKDQIWRSDNTGGSYTDITNNLPSNTITDIEIKSDDPNTAWVTLGGYDGNRVYQTIDGGSTWTNISTGLPDLPTMTIVQNDQNTSEVELYVGTDVGIYVKLGSAPWVEFANGLPNVVVTDLKFYYDATPANSVLYAATFGRGVWSSDPYQPATLDASIAAINSPSDEYCQSGSTTANVQLSNIGSTTLTSCDITYTIDGGTPAVFNWAGSLAQGASVDIDLGSLTLAYGSHDIEVVVSNPNGGVDGNISNDSKFTNYYVWDNSLPYTQNFDNFESQIGNIGTTITLNECWVNETSESNPNLDWSCTAGATPSGSTGPSQDHTSGAGKYLYTETSDDAAELKMANVLSPVFDLTNYVSPTVSFWYHMLGNEIGSIQVDLYYNSAWHNAVPVSWNGTTATNLSGAQGDAWYQAVVVDASAADGASDFQVRISVTTGPKEVANGTNFYQSDFAIDDVSIDATIACIQPNTQASSFGTTPSFTTMDISWTRGDGDNVLVVAREGTAVDTDPAFSTNYTANTAFGSGDQIGTGNYVVYNGSGTNVTVTGLTQGTDYHFAIYEYNNTDYCYLLPALTGNSITLVPAPSISAIFPDNFYADLGGSITIQGTDFNGISSVMIGGVSGTISSNDGTTLVVDFPAGSYTDNTLTVTNSGGSDNATCTVNTRNVIPVGNGTNTHSTIASALNGLVAWWGTTTFDADKIIDVYSGTYTETITPDVTMNPTSLNMLIIRAHQDETPVIDATGNANGINIGALNYVRIEGFSVFGATNDNIYTEGDYNEIAFNRCYGSTAGSGISLNTSLGSTVTHNLAYDNYNYGVHLTNSDNVIAKNNTSSDNGHSIVNQLDQQLFYYDVESGDYTGWTMPATWVVYNDPAFANSPTNSFMCNQSSATLAYSSVSIAGYDNLTISAYARSDGNLNTNDHLYGEYSFDNTNWVQFFHISNDNPTYSQYTLTGVNTSAGTETTLHIRFRAILGGTGRYWHVDDIEVRGDQAGPEGTVGAGLYVESGNSITLENNILVAKTGTDFLALRTNAGSSISTDYNTYYKDAGNTNLVNYLGTDYADFAAWPNEGANDLESDPLFVNAGTDFHLQSTFGSFQGGQWPPISAIDGVWTNDASFSPAIDAGNADAFANEPSENGSVINQGCYGNTQQASKTAASTGTNGLWTGAISTNWFVSANWDDGNVPTEVTNVVIDNVPNQPVINSDGVCNDLTINTGAVVTVDPSGFLVLNGTLTNNVGSAGLIINSDVSGDGAIIYNNTGINATIQRYLDAPALANQWHYLAAPITAAPVSHFGLNFYSYNESTDDWWTGATVYGTSGWTIPSGNLAPLTGYIYYTPQATINYTGELNYNAVGYVASINYTEHAGNAGNGNPYSDFDGWNLVGNPYPCELDWEAITKSNVDATIYYYDDQAHNYAYYIEGVGSVNGGSRYIPSMQGFFVKASNNSGGTLTIPNSARLHTGQSYFKSSAKSNSGFVLRLSISENNHTDEVLVSINDDATLSFDNQLDAYKRFSWDSNIPQIFTLNNERQFSYSINCLPTTAGQLIVPLGFKYKREGNYPLSITDLRLEGYHVLLEDLQLNTQHNLRDNPEVNIEYTMATSESRYQLNILKNNAPSMTQNIADQEVAVGETYSYTVPENTFYDVDLNDKLTYSATLSNGYSLPHWLSFNKISQTFTGISADAQEVEITVTATDLLGASTSSTFKLKVTTETTSSMVVKNAQTYTCKVFPNPSDGRFSIEVNKDYGLIYYKIISSDGKVVKENKIRNQGNNPVDILGIEKGTYILNITLDNNLVINKSIIIEY